MHDAEREDPLQPTHPPPVDGDHPRPGRAGARAGGRPGGHGGLRAERAAGRGTGGGAPARDAGGAPGQRGPRGAGDAGAAAAASAARAGGGERQRGDARPAGRGGAAGGVGFQMIDLLKAVDGIIPNFAGIKYTHEDFMDFLSCLHFNNGKYDMLWGRDENMLAALAIGANGAVGSTFNYAAPLYYKLIDAFNRGDLKEAQQLQQQSIDMIRLLGKYGGIATGKAYMKLVGMDCGEFRLPVKNMSPENFELFKQEVDSLNFKQYCSRQA